PWPHQIFHRDLESIQVKFWRDFAENNGITLINLFPEFIDDRGHDIIYNTYFITGDVHWNPAGHQRVAMKVMAYIQGSR
ncbi:MAG: SGNH/GDSL hydrolase family protein, partial [Candidatus Aminicenantes bacterium]